MAVPARPTSGTPIESLWGQVAHDTAVAQDIQSGVVNVSINAAQSGNYALTFPRPFGGVPLVFVAQAANSNGYIVAVGTAWSTGVTITAGLRATGTGTATIAVNWLAIGPRA